MVEIGRRAFVAALAALSPSSWLTGRAQTFSLDDFLALSSRLSGRLDLDREAAKILLNALLSTADGDARLRRPDDTLEREIIAAWYTGIYTVRGEPRLLTHSGALHWRAVGVTAPGTCTGRFGAWSQAPRAALR
jgi:hypothetical protein